MQKKIKIKNIQGTAAFDEIKDELFEAYIDCLKNNTDKPLNEHLRDSQEKPTNLVEISR